MSPRPAVGRHTTLAAVVQQIGAEFDAPHGVDETVTITGVSMDSRDIAPGDLYAALPGANVHGASFAAAAVGAGAVAVLTDASGAEMVRAQGAEVPVLTTPEPRTVLGAVSALVFGTTDLPLRMLGITGTNGKTTTAYLLCSALEALGLDTGLIGTVETRIKAERIRSVRTTPEMTVLHALLAVMVERGLDACAMEVSSHALSQHRVDGVRYDLALFTNLSRDHLEFHPTMRDYFEAKASLFSPDRAERGIICVDDEWGQELARTAAIPLTTMTTLDDVSADWRVGANDPADPQAFSLTGPEGSLSLRSALPGDFNQANTAMAALALLGLGFGTAAVEQALAVDPHVPGRMERVRVADDQPLTVVDYAHTPDAVAAALRALRPQTSGRLVVVLGAGGDRDPGKREAMGAAAASHADVVVVTDDNPRSEDPAAIRAQLMSGATAARDARPSPSSVEVREVGGRAEAIKAGVEAALAVPGSALAVVGKGHETGQDIDGTVHPFDDRESLAAALNQALGKRADA